VPVAVLALAFLYLGGGLGWAIALVVFPKIFTYARNLLIEARDAAHVVAARARGVGTARILIWHIAPAVAPALVALGGVSVSMAFGAAIPIEAICDSPGLGQLAFRAALARDLPLLVSVTLLVTLLTRVANGISDVALAAWGGRTA
jgi:peptide/nickel transport system permease protein